MPDEVGNWRRQVAFGSYLITPQLDLDLLHAEYRSPSILEIPQCNSITEKRCMMSQTDRELRAHTQLSSHSTSCGSSS